MLINDCETYKKQMLLPIPPTKITKCYRTNTNFGDVLIFCITFYSTEYGLGAAIEMSMHKPLLAQIPC